MTSRTATLWALAGLAGCTVAPDELGDRDPAAGAEDAEVGEGAEEEGPDKGTDGGGEEVGESEASDGGEADGGSEAFGEGEGEAEGEAGAAFGDPCDDNDACESGWCVDLTRDSSVCSRLCNFDCPEAWTCRTLVNSGGDALQICVPDRADLDGDGFSPDGDPADCDDDDEHVRPDKEERCDGVDDDCDGDTDEGFEGLGEVCRPGLGECAAVGLVVCAEDGRSAACDVRPGPPVPERCNGLDDDCDGTVDNGFEGLGVGCVVGTGACGAFGELVCTEDEQAVTCDAQPLPPGEEVCNGADDDCDGVVDNGFELLGRACVSGVGECERAGLIVCAEDGDGITCGAVPGPPAEEACNGLDDDCDGERDNGFPGLGEPCVVGEGICASEGLGVCDDLGAGVVCEAPEPVGEPERCNGVDDDCDGLVDDGLAYEGLGLGEECVVGVGACEAVGLVVCADPDNPDHADRRGEAVCSAQPGEPGAEICDNDVDEDCDGEAAVDCDVSGELAPGFPFFWGVDGLESLDTGLGIDVDDDGFAWVAGFSTPENKMALWRVSSAGELADGFPILRNNDGGNPEIPRSEGTDVAIAPNGDAVVAGRSYSGRGTWMATVWRFARDGSLRQTFPRFGGDNSNAHGVTVDGRGFIWMVGSRRTDGRDDLAVWRFDDQGAITDGFPTFRGEIIGQERMNLGFDVQVDGDGVAWVAGWSRWDRRHRIATLWAFDDEGELAHPIWRWPGDGDEFQSGIFDLALGGDGSIWAVGRTQDPGEPEWMSIFKFDPAGRLLDGFPVSRTGDAGRRGNHGAYGVDVDEDGDVWASGYGLSETSHEMLLWRADADGAWVDGWPIIRADDGGVVSTDIGNDVAVGPDGAVWVTGQTRTEERRDDMVLWRFE